MNQLCDPSIQQFDILGDGSGIGSGIGGGGGGGGGCSSSSDSKSDQSITQSSPQYSNRTPITTKFISLITNMHEHWNQYCTSVTVSFFSTIFL